MSSTELTNWIQVKRDALIVVAREKKQNQNQTERMF